ncbi:hypothetical protein T06_9935 [Trichinella sp. T6]|nr:hypothetical protein T06_9935 [Trichinella sp. T6]
MNLFKRVQTAHSLAKFGIQLVEKTEKTLQSQTKAQISQEMNTDDGVSGMEPSLKSPVWGMRNAADDYYFVLDTKKNFT